MFSLAFLDVSNGPLARRFNQFSPHHHIVVWKKKIANHIFLLGTSGDTEIAAQAILAAGSPHHFLSVTKHGLAAIVSTTVCA